MPSQPIMSAELTLMPAAPSATSTKLIAAQRQDVVALAALLRGLSNAPRPGSQGETARRLFLLLDEAQGAHPTRPVLTAKALASALGQLARPPRPQAGVGLPVLVVLASLLAVGLLALVWSGVGPPPVRAPAGRAPDPVADGGALSPLLGRGSAGASSAWPGPEAVLGSWTCTSADRPQQVPELRFSANGQLRIQVDLKKGRTRICEGDWVAVAPNRYRVTGACTVSGSTAASPYRTSFTLVGSGQLVRGDPQKPNAWRCRRPS